MVPVWTLEGYGTVGISKKQEAICRWIYFRFHVWCFLRIRFRWLFGFSWLLRQWYIVSRHQLLDPVRWPSKSISVISIQRIPGRKVRGHLVCNSMEMDTDSVTFRIMQFLLWIAWLCMSYARGAKASSYFLGKSSKKPVPDLIRLVCTCESSRNAVCSPSEQPELMVWPDHSLSKCHCKLLSIIGHFSGLYFLSL